MAAVNAAVLRVKRRFNEEPLDALVFACKRRKKEEDSVAENDNPFTKILKFAGTVKNQEENVALHLESFRKDVKALTHVPDVSGKLREETKQLSKESRYKVVNFHRALDADDVNRSEPSKDAAPEKGHFTEGLNNVMILDIEDNAPADEKDGYVYDLYYTGAGTDDWDDALLDQMVSVRPLPSDLVFKNADSDSDHLEDDADSNAEDNPGNEYPDTDESLDEDRLAMELGELHVGNEELSSDEEDEEYLRCEDADPMDIARYGQGYARYKARVTRQLYNETTSDSDDNSSNSD